MGSFVAGLDATAVNVALPAIQRDLGGGLAGQQWVSNAYLLMLGSLILVGGSLGDMYGERRVFALGVGGFGVASLICALAPSIEAARRGARAAGHLRRAADPERARGDRHGLPGRRARGARSARGRRGRASPRSSGRSRAAGSSTRRRGAGSSRQRALRHRDAGARRHRDPGACPAPSGAPSTGPARRFARSASPGPSTA